MNKLSKIYQPLQVIPRDAVIKNKDITSKSQKLMLELGLIKSTANGTFHIFPIARRAIDKCIKLVDSHMKEINGQKCIFPILTSSDLWKKSGRLKDGEDVGELYITKERSGQEFILSPTHEEAAAALLASYSPVSYKEFPLKLYQIGHKFRNELKPRYGLIRAKEFIMKDLYSFDIGLEEANKTYAEIGGAYMKLLDKLEIPWKKVKGNPGDMGGDMSHEYQVPTTIGEDKIISCKNCDFASNQELFAEAKSCPECGNQNLEFHKGIEVAHTFLLGSKYSKPIGAKCLQSNGKPKELIMGSYGIGITRLIAASLEALSTENQLRWPLLLAPFTVCIIPPKDGSKEQVVAQEWVKQIYSELVKFCEPDEILLDDRGELTIGKKLMNSKRIGYPIIIVVGSKATEENAKFELYFTNLDLKLEVEFTDLISETLKCFSEVRH